MAEIKMNTLNPKFAKIVDDYVVIGHELFDKKMNHFVKPIFQGTCTQQRYTKLRTLNGKGTDIAVDTFLKALEENWLW